MIIVFGNFVLLYWQEMDDRHCVLNYIEVLVN
jgi:hypothetical protein